MKKLMAAAVFAVMGLAACMTDTTSEKTPTELIATDGTDGTSTTSEREQASSAPDVAETDATLGATDALTCGLKPVCQGDIDNCKGACICEFRQCVYTTCDSATCHADETECLASCH